MIFRGRGSDRKGRELLLGLKTFAPECLVKPRKAPGADSRDVLRLVFRFGARFILPGMGVGVAASPGAARILHSRLRGLSPHDPVALVWVVVTLLTVGFLPCWCRARRVDPVVALRYD